MNDWDIVVIGGGPAGASAALMAHSVGMSVVLFECARICGQLTHIPILENLLGWPLSGSDYAKAVELQLKSKSIPHMVQSVTGLQNTGTGWNVILDDGNVHSATSVILATGTRLRRLSESLRVASSADVECTPLHLIDPTSLTASPIVIVGCDRIFWTWADQYMPQCSHLSFVVLAFPDKWHLEANLKGMANVRFVRCEKVVTISASSDHPEIVYTDTKGTNQYVTAAHIASILGTIPNMDLIHSLGSFSSDGFLTREAAMELALAGCYLVGDVAHREAQRIAVAIGDGAEAALECFYKKNRLYGR